MAELLVVGSKVKDFISKQKVRTGGDFLPALSKEMECVVASAIKRAKANGRQTVRADDL